MPTYDYQCRSCGIITEVVHSMLEDGPTACAACGGPLRRVVHAAGIIFKGSGFYKTDSRSSGSASVAAGNRPKPASPESGSGGGSSLGDSSSSSAPPASSDTKPKAESS